MKFELDENEQKQFSEWYKKHLDEAHDGEEPYCGAAGGRVSFIITPTGIGTFLAAECGVCARNELKDRVVAALFDRDVTEGSFKISRVNLTDFSDW